MKLTCNKLFLSAGIACSLMAFTNNPVQANEAEDYYQRYLGNRFFPTQLTVRSVGLGGAYVALKDNSLGTVGNPATLGGLSTHELSFTYQYENIDGEDPSSGLNAEVDTHRGLILGSFAITPELGLGLGFVPNNGDGDGAAPDSDTMIVPFGVGYQLNEQFSLGYGLGFYDDDYDTAGFRGENDKAFLHRFGMMYSYLPEINFGLLGTYGHGDAKSRSITGMRSNTDLEQWGIRGGMTWQFMDQLMWVADLGYESMENDGVVSVPGVPIPMLVGTEEELDILTITTGLEYLMNEDFLLRTGVGFNHYDYDSIDPAMDAVLGSNGLFHWAGGLSYTWTESVDTDLGVQVRFSDDVDFLAGITSSIKF